MKARFILKNTSEKIYSSNENIVISLFYGSLAKAGNILYMFFRIAQDIWVKRGFLVDGDLIFILVI